MKKIKLIMLGLLSFLTLGLFVVTGTKVNADDIQYIIEADFTGIDAAISSSSTGTAKTLYDAGWRTESTGTSTFNGVKYLKYTPGSNPAQYLKSPDFVNGSGNTVTKTVDVSISVGTTASSKALTFTLYAYDENDSVVASGEGATGKSNAFNSNDLTLTSTTNDIKYIKFEGVYNGDTAKAGCVSTISISFVEKDDSIARVNFYVDGKNVASPEIDSEGTVSMPSTPTKDGYTFNGWLKEDGKAFNNTGLSETINVYADFTLDSLVETEESLGKVGFGSTGTNYSDNTLLNASYELYAIADENHTMELNTSGKTFDGYKFPSRIKFGGVGSKDYRSIKMNINSLGQLKLYVQSSSSDATACLVIADSNGIKLFSKSGVVNGGEVVTYDVTVRGTYYIYCETNDSDTKFINLFGFEMIQKYYTPNVSLSVDTNGDNTKVRVTAIIDNLNVVSEKLNGIVSMKYTINGIDEDTWKKDITSAYTSVDSATTGFYKAKDYTAYAIVVFSGYDSLTTDFDIKFTIELANGQTVEKTITVPAHHAAA